jgi:ribosomal protein L37AE/L43A
MKDLETGVVYLELKYCERCGGLGLRRAGSGSPFCVPCSRVMAGLSPNSNLATHVRSPLPANDSRDSRREGVNA